MSKDKLDEFPAKLFTAYEEVRKSGKCNMGDSACVINEMAKNGHVMAATHLIETTGTGKLRVDSNKYSRFLKEVIEVYDVEGIMTKD